MAGKYLDISTIIVAVLMYEILYVYCKLASRLIFDSFAIECVLIGNMTLDKRVNK